MAPPGAVSLRHLLGHASVNGPPNLLTHPCATFSQRFPPHSCPFAMSLDDDLSELLRLFLKPGDWFALIVCAGLGFAAGYYVHADHYAIVVSMLAAYHLFLLWLVLTSEKTVETMRPFLYTASIHLACVAVIVSIGVGGGRIVPHFDFICCGIAILAFFERDWLFQPIGVSAPVTGEPDDPVLSSAEEYQKWQTYLGRQRNNPDFDGPLKDQFEHWLQERRKSRVE